MIVVSTRLRLEIPVNVDPVGPMGCIALHIGTRCASDQQGGGRCGLFRCVGERLAPLEDKAAEMRRDQTANESRRVRD